MMSLNVPAGFTMEGFFESRIDALAADPEHPRNVGRRDAAQFERHDLLLALGNIDLGCAGTSVTTIGHFGN